MRVLPAKITRPALKGIVERKRLFRLLDGARKQPVVWVTGPAGSGKTTLVGSYIESRGLPCLWYQMDAGDSDPSTFFYYLGLAGRQASPRKRPLPPLTPEYALGVPAFSKRFFEELTVRLRVPSVIVLDGYQEAAMASGLHEALANGLSALREGVSVVILSRLAPPAAFARLHAANAVFTLDWSVLRFTEEESKALLKLHLGAGRLQRSCGALHEKARGWAAGLVLLARRCRSEDLPGGSLPGAGSGEVFDYFAGEIFDRTDPATRDFLLKTAFLPSMTARLAGAISGHDHAGAVLQSLSRDHYFTDRLSGPEQVYQFHPLFREFLLARAGKTFTAQQEAKLQKRAAGLLEQDNRFEDAADLLVAAADWQALARLALVRAPVLGRQGRFSVLEKWLRSLPGGLVDNAPWLRYWLGVCRLPFDQKESESHFEKAFAQFSAAGDAPGTCLSWSGIVDSILYGFEDFKRLDGWISRLPGSGARPGPGLPDDITSRMAVSMFSALVHRGPEHPDLQQWAERALSMSAGDAAAGSQALLLLMFDRTAAGDMVGAEHAFASVKALEKSPDIPPLALLNTKVAKTLYYNIVAQPKECRETVREGMEIANRTGVHVMDLMILGNGAISALGEEKRDEAERLLRKMTALSAGARPWDLSLYYFLAAWHNFLQDDLAEARRLVDASLALTEQVGTPFSAAASLLLKAHVLHASGEERSALGCIARARDIGRRRNGRGFDFMGLLAGAEFALDRDRRTALGHLREALAIGREEGYVHTFFLWRGRALSRLCAAALEEGIETDYVRGLIRKRGLLPESPPLHGEEWPWPLRIFTLGRFTVLKDDSPLRSGGKGRRKPVEMLKVLIALGGRGIREDRISDILWPDADGDAAHSNFATTLSRLRDLLGGDETVEFRDGRLSLDGKRCWVDAWAFERAISEAEARGLSERTAGPAERSLALYRGAFLASDDEDWTFSLRERLRRRFLQGLLDLGLFRENAGEWKKAMESYQKGLRVDELSEELYQRLMISCARLGLRAEALSAYEQCRRSLRRAFAVDPSARTEAIYREIKAGG